MPSVDPPQFVPEIPSGATPSTPISSGASTTLAPLRHTIFFALLTTTFASNIGMWMQDVGASWLMTSLAPSPVMVSLIQTAVNLPYFLLALGAGALADIADRRRLLLVAQVWMLASACSLGVLTVFNLTTPWLLLGLSFSLGVGATLSGPGLQAIVPELVDRSEIREAVTLNSVQSNLARGIGPAIGGFVVTAWGSGAAFLANASLFISVIGVLASWRRPHNESMLPAERLLGAVRAGTRYVRYSPALRAVMIRSFLFAFGTSAMWAVLPLIVRQSFHLDATGYGIVVAFFGIGATTGGLIMPAAQRILSIDKVGLSGVVLFAAVNATIAWTHDVHILWLATFTAGIAWVVTTTTFNSATQVSLASWVRGRALAMFLLVIQGGIAVGSVGWGYLASRVGIRSALDYSAIFMIFDLAIALHYSIRDSEHFDPKPWMFWQMPMVHEEVNPDRGPVEITTEYRIDPARAQEFERAMHALELIRRRDGAIAWSLSVDIADPARYFETFIVKTWGEHMRQHHRLTTSDSGIALNAHSFHLGPEPPVVTHRLPPLSTR